MAVLQNCKIICHFCFSPLAKRKIICHIQIIETGKTPRQQKDKAMYYSINAYNSQAIIVWASNYADVERYVDWLNKERDINFYSAAEVPEEQQAEYEGRGDVLSMDEPHWDDFMDEDEQ